MYMAELATSRSDALTAEVHNPQMKKIVYLILVRLTGAKLHQIRTAGVRQFVKTNPQSIPDSSQLPPSSLSTESLVFFQ